MTLRIVVESIVLYPLVIALLIAVLPWKESWLSRAVIVANVLNGLLTAALLALFIASGFHPVEISGGHLVQAGNYHFNFLLLVDKYSVSFQVLIGILTGLVLMFSRRYMHRERGYKRFFASLFLFVAGISLVSLAATIDVLFAGWEIVGVSSFLLIGFYRIRLQPGRNSLRAYTIYRVCDVGLFMGAWLFHKLGSEYFFLQHADRPLDAQFVQLNLWFFTAIGLLTVLAAMGKSAQYPFSFWVPRAMEGPTPSSAIFYGALSIHAGVYLLIRMWPLWRAVEWIPWLVGAVGLMTSITATISLKTQSNIKGQIGYASVAQVGLMFIELAAGLREIAMLHFLGNAILRCYQLLASPSIMVLYLRQQAEGALLSRGFSGYAMSILSEAWRRRFFAFSFSEGYAEALMVFLWRKLKQLAGLVQRAFSPFVFINVVLALLLLESFGRPFLGEGLIHTICAVVFGFSSIFVALSALGQGVQPARVLWLTGLSTSFKGLSVVYLSPENAIHSLLYFSGISIGFLIARAGLRFIPEDVQTTEYAGAAELYPRATNAYFMGILWMSGFTLSPTFFGDDILLHTGAEKFAYETFFMAGAFVLNAITLLRSYVKLAFAR
jgi:NADH:ubiquinone oxidoreductase subunit 5 (subunit L)/multisubunit Na+/H+ antiporter MnhA subunit